MRRFVLPIVLVFAIAGAVGPVIAQNPPPQIPASDPQLALWQNLKRQLQAPNGKQYFELVLRDARVPGPTDSVQALRGTVVSSKPSKRPSELVLAMSDDHTPEVTLTLRDARLNLTPLSRPIPNGALVEFYGIPVLFTQNPIMLTFEVKAENGPSGANPRFLTKGPPKAKP